MRVRYRTETISVEHDVGGRSGSQRGTTTCTNREVPLSEVIDNFWGGNFPERATSTMDVTHRFEDVVLPDYAARRRSGDILPTNPMARSMDMESLPRLYSKLAYIQYRRQPCKSNVDHQSISFRQGTVQAVISTPGPLTRILSDSDVRQAQIEALARLRSQGMDALTSIWELNQTLAMLAGARKKLIKLFTDGVRYLRRKGYKDIPKSVSGLLDLLSNVWLEGRFGWRILYYDLLAIMDFLKRRSEEVKLIVGRSLATASRSGGSSTTMAYTLTDEVRIGYPGFLDLSKIGNYSIANTAWDSLRFSLVVDMFFDVQGWIISLSGTPLNVKELPNSAFLVRRLTRESIIQAQTPVPPEGFQQIVFNDAAAAYLVRKGVTRTRIGEPTLGLPPFRLSLGGYKPVDLAFLLRIIAGKL